MYVASRQVATVDLQDVPFVPELARDSPCSSTMPICAQAGLFSRRSSPNGSP